MTFAGDPGYYDYSLNFDGRTIESHACESYGDGGRPDGCDPADYSTSAFARHATEFVREPGGERPFFLMFTPYAPHMPAEAAPGDEDKFRGFRHRPDSFNEKDLEDKPNWLREDHGKPLSDKDVRDIDGRRLRQVRSLLGVDRAVEDLIDELRRSSKLDDTLIVFTSDNGYQWGEHRLEGKLTPYQESVRAPLIVKGPGIRHGSTDLIAANIDLAPTIADVARATPSLTVDGRSLEPLFAGAPAHWRDDLLIEHWSSEHGVLRVPTYLSLVDERFKYVEYAGSGNAPELYDLVTDGFELENRAGDDGERSRIAQMAARLHALATCAGAICR